RDTDRDGLLPCACARILATEYAATPPATRVADEHGEPVAPRDDERRRRAGCVAQTNGRAKLVASEDGIARVDDAFVRRFGEEVDARVAVDALARALAVERET